MVLAYYGFSTGAYVPGCHRNLPFSWKKPSKELQPGPPFNQIVISLTGFPMVGLNMKNSAREAFFSSMGINPEYISPMSKLTSGSESILYSAKYESRVGSKTDGHELTGCGAGEKLISVIGGTVHITSE